MPGNFLLHLQRNWPLAAATLVLLAIVSYAFFTGVLPTNRGGIPKSHAPGAYRRWLRRLSTLLALSIAVLVGSYFLATQ